METFSINTPTSINNTLHVLGDLYVNCDLYINGNVTCLEIHSVDKCHSSLVNINLSDPELITGDTILVNGNLIIDTKTHLNDLHVDGIIYEFDYGILRKYIKHWYYKMLRNKNWELKYSIKGFPAELRGFPSFCNGIWFDEYKNNCLVYY